MGNVAQAAEVDCNGGRAEERREMRVAGMDSLGGLGTNQKRRLLPKKLSNRSRSSLQDKHSATSISKIGRSQALSQYAASVDTSIGGSEVNSNLACGQTFNLECIDSVRELTLRSILRATTAWKVSTPSANPSSQCLRTKLQNSVDQWARQRQLSDRSKRARIKMLISMSRYGSANKDHAKQGLHASLVSAAAAQYSCPHVLCRDDAAGWNEGTRGVR